MPTWLSCCCGPGLQSIANIQWEIHRSLTFAGAAAPSPARLLLSWQSCCSSGCLRPVVAGCCRPSLHVSVRQALPDLSSAGGLPAPRRGPLLHHIPSNYWHPAAFEHTGIIVKNSRGQTADGEGWKRQSLSKRERKRKGGRRVKSYLCHWCLCSPLHQPSIFFKASDWTLIRSNCFNNKDQGAVRVKKWPSDQLKQRKQSHCIPEKRQAWVSLTVQNIWKENLRIFNKIQHSAL